MAEKRINQKTPQGPRSGRVVEKPKDFFGSLSRLLKYTGRYFPLMVTAVVLAVAGAIFAIVGPGQLSKITDLITSGITGGGIDMDAVIAACLFTVFLYALSGGLSYIQGFIMSTITQKVSKLFRSEIIRKINKLPLRYFDSNNNGDIISRITNDVDTIGNALNSSISQLLSCIALILGTIIMMLITSPLMTLAAVAAAVVGFIIMMVIMSRSQKYFRRQQNELGNINGHVEEIYSGHIAVKAYNGEDNAREEFDTINKRWRDSAWKSQFLSGLMMPIMQFVGNFGYVAVCVVGVMLVLSGDITFGVIVAFMIYVRLFTNPLAQVAQCMTQLQTATAAGERVFEFMDEHELSDESGKHTDIDPAKIRGEVEFDHVRFGYNEDRVIIKDFSAKLDAGKKIAIVGPTGAGKTTLVNLLMRFYDVNSGDIRIDGTSVYDMTREQVHDLFGMVLQDTWLFEGTVRENIRYSKQEATDEEIEKACRAAGVHHFITTLPKGYDTVLDDKANLSAGQKQLLTIARAMVENAPLLILDEATSSVDTRTEILIQQAMDSLTEGRTSFVIAHRLSTIKNADLILVMKDGDIIEQGDHKTLMSQGGFYCDLYNSQFDTEEDQ
ncbi:MAG: ABC transporter ATP-binding protein [Christensenellaceae bacterium]|nr:ABC transporter ATP-binding protein [Christensenellaceae bacterium]